MSEQVIPYPALERAYTKTPSGVKRRIDMLVLHATGGVKAGDLWTLSGRDSRHLVSVHGYITKQGEIYELVKDNDVAWHAGVSFWQGESDVNQFSIGVEFENLNNGRDPYPQVQIDAGQWWCRRKVEAHRIRQSRVLSHAQVALPPGRKTDPRGFPTAAFVQALYAAQQPWPASYRVRWDKTYVRTGPSSQADRATFGRTLVELPAGQVISIAGMVAGEAYTHPVLGTSNQWAWWVETKNGKRLENGFIWAPQLVAA